MAKLAPEIREAVLSILSPVLSKCNGKIDVEMIEKSLTDIAEYAYCPHCYSRVYKSTIMLEQSTSTTEKSEDEPSDDTRADGEGAKGEKAAGSTFFKGLNSAIENH